MALMCLLYAATATGTPADTLSHNTTIEMIWIAPGTFLMGSPESEVGHNYREQQHEVTLSRGFWLGKTEVTQRLWQAVTGSNPSRLTGDDLLPVEQVSWLDCVNFCNALSKREGLAPAYRITDENVFWDELADGYRLPTEAEWEYACRAGTTGRFAGDLDEMAVYGKNSGRKTRVVGGRVPNAWGLHDMHGNVWEWCWDWFKRDYGTNPVADPTGADEGVYRVQRGGSWHRGSADCRSATRGADAVGTRRTGLGLRLVRWAN